jgi:DtxR family Mn-dependent transcriptional regulator
MPEVTRAVEECLEQVLRLEDSSGAARTKMLARRLGVSLGTVTNSLSRLERLGYVRRQRYKGARLTKQGHKVALNVLRRHRLTERLLTDVLHISWSRAHAAACKLEHCIDEEVTNAALAHPKTCPHGNPIPRPGIAVSDASTRLAELSAHDAGIVVRVVDEEEEGALPYLESIGLIPGADFTVEGHVPFDGAVILTLRESEFTVSKRAASLVVVQKRGLVKGDARRV